MKLPVFDRKSILTKSRPPGMEWTAFASSELLGELIWFS